MSTRHNAAGLIAAWLLVTATPAAAQQPTLTAASIVVVPGAAASVTVTGIPGRFYAVLGSTTGAGFSYAGVTFRVGPDVAILASGTLGASGTVTIAVTPPFLGSVLDRYYVQAVTSATPSYVPPETSAGLVLRNADLVAGVTVIAVTPTGAFNLDNANGLVSAGAPGSGGPVPAGAGTRFVWNPRKSALRAGTVFDDAWDDASVGLHSTALGYNTRATAVGTTAIGYNAQAVGEAATSIGFATGATGIGSLALGYATSATGLYATALGNQTVSSSTASTAMGDFTTASGPKSTAMGSNATTAGFAGAFVYGDSSFNAGQPVAATAANQVTFRAAGGYRLFTNSDSSLGAELPAGATAWSVLSDRRTKEHFRDLDGEEVLARLAAVPVREWNYKAQGTAVRHVGPTAQDFHAAFGLGENPLRISTIDPDGISLRAIQALDTRSKADRTAVEQLQRLLETLSTEVEHLRSEVSRLKAAARSR